MIQLALAVMVALVVIGVLLFLINRYLGTWMQPAILQLMNIAVVVIVAIAVAFWILSAFGLLPLAGGPPVPKLR